MVTVLCDWIIQKCFIFKLFKLCSMYVAFWQQLCIKLILYSSSRKLSKFSRYLWNKLLSVPLHWFVLKSLVVNDLELGYNTLSAVSSGGCRWYEVWVIKCVVVSATRRCPLHTSWFAAWWAAPRRCFHGLGGQIRLTPVIQVNQGVPSNWHTATGELGKICKQ